LVPSSANFSTVTSASGSPEEVSPITIIQLSMVLKEKEANSSLSPPYVCCHRIPDACEKIAEPLNKRINKVKMFLIAEV
jgi:hypothetical protein